MKINKNHLLFLVEQYLYPLDWCGQGKNGFICKSVHGTSFGQKTNLKFSQAYRNKTFFLEYVLIYIDQGNPSIFSLNLNGRQHKGV